MTNVRLQVCCTQEIQQGKHTPDALDSMSNANLAISLRLPKDMHSPPTKCSFGKEKKRKGQSTLIWTCSGSIWSHAQEYFKPTVFIVSTTRIHSNNVFWKEIFSFILNSFIHSAWSDSGMNTSSFLLELQSHLSTVNRDAGKASQCK